MPSKTPKQAKFMRAIAHGWTPSRMKSPPSRAVAQEFVEADRKYSGGFAENRYWTGGLAAMNEVNSGVPETLNWQEGGDVWTPWGPGTESQLSPEQEHFLRLNIQPGGTFSTMLAKIQDQAKEQAYPTTPTITAPTATYSGSRFTGPRGGGRRGGRGGGRRDGGREPNGDEGRPPGGGPGTAPPRIVSSYPAVAGGPLPLDKESTYRDQLRAHKASIASILGTGSAEGGPVNYYQEGGTVRPGHAEGPNPYPPDSARYRRWERENHRDPAPPPTAEAAPEEELSWWEKLIAGKSRTERELEEMGEAHGGRVSYQAGGLAMAAPAGGVPPWIEPTGSGPGYMESPGYMDEPPPGYQFGGMAAKFGPAMRGARSMQQYRGVPPQRGGIQRGAPPGGDIRGGLAAMMQQARSQRGAIPGGGRVQAGGGMYTDPTHPAYSPPGSGGSFDMSGSYTPPTRGPLAGVDPTGGGRGKPGRGIIPLAGDEDGGGIPGGPRVPPNMRGYLQRQRMMNRPPANVGGGVNRVGMQDQQGGMARALQRGTGRPPMSRRSAFPGSRR